MHWNESKLLRAFDAHIEVTRSALPPLSEVTLVEVCVTRKAFDIGQIIILTLLVATITSIPSRWLHELKLAFVQLSFDAAAENLTFLKSAPFTQIIVT